MFQSRFAALIAIATKEEKELKSLNNLYPDVPELTVNKINLRSKTRKSGAKASSKASLVPTADPLNITITNARPVGVRVVTPVRVMIINANREIRDEKGIMLPSGAWVIDNEVVFTWEWNATEGKMVRKTIAANYSL